MSSDRIHNDETIQTQHAVEQPLLAPDPPVIPRSLPLAKKRVAAAICSVLVLVIDLGFFLTAAPLMEVVQDTICSKYDPCTPKLGPEICKSEVVQREMALVLGWLETFTLFPGALMFAICWTARICI